MNHWTKLSIEFANQRNYLDELFRVYPLAPEEIRNIDKDIWQAVEQAFHKKDKVSLIRNLLSLKLFPIKDSYVAYLKRDRSAIDRNPATIDRICGRLFEMGLNKIYERSSEPKETNRQIGPLFKNWLVSGALGCDILDNIDNFLKTERNAILIGSDNKLMSFAREYLQYTGTKGLDLVAKFYGRYVIGEAKFLTDFGGHQNAQFRDAISLLEKAKSTAIHIAILDGVCYIPTDNIMYRYLSNHKEEYNIMSALLLRDFLYQV